jgi:hypothetical protein
MIGRLRSEVPKALKPKKNLSPEELEKLRQRMLKRIDALDIDALVKKPK